MSRFALLLAASISLVGIGADRPATVADKPIDQGVVLAFMADWCIPCQKMRPILADLGGEGYLVEIIDVDKYRGLSDHHQVDALPTFIAIGQSGEYWRQVGAMSEYDLRRQLIRAQQVARIPDRPAKTRGKVDDGSEPTLPGAISTEELLRVTYELAEPQAKALVKLLKEHTKQDFDATIQKDRLTITAAPGFHETLAPFITNLLKHED